MKSCPKCGYDLPERAHFCPKCMYEYPQEKMKSYKEPSARKAKRIVYIALFVFVLIKLVMFFWPEKEKQGESSPTESNPIELDSVFDKGTEIVYNEITYDLRDGLTDYETLRQRLGENTIVELDVDDDGEVYSIFIDYQELDAEDKKAYGVFGVNGETTREQVVALLGNPEQNYGEAEYHYRFDGHINAPSLIIAFDETGVVTAIQFYRMIY